MALAETYITPDQYLKIDEGNAFKSEYLNGVMTAMAGGSDAHNRISANLVGLVFLNLRGTQCKPTTSDQRIWTPGDNYLYADLVVYCGNGEFSGQLLLNPTVIFEVLSPTTEARDRGDKMIAYRKTESLKTYVLVSQHMRKVEVYSKVNDLWHSEEVTEGSIALESIGVTLAIADIYEDVTLATPDA